MKTFSLPFGIAITVTPGNGTDARVSALTGSQLAKELQGADDAPEDQARGQGMADGMEALLVALVAEGLDLADPRYASALQVAVEACGNH